MIPAAAGATTPNVCTCAITSCLLFFSSSAAISNCFRSRCYRISPTSNANASEAQHLSEETGTNEVVLHLFDRFIGDWKSELLLRDGEVEPKLSPSLVPALSKQ
jgi:hypothetical protein